MVSSNPLHDKQGINVLDAPFRFGSDIVALLFSALDRDVAYVLLTDLDDGLASRDIDLYVPFAEKPRFLNILRQQGWLERKEPPYHVNHIFYFHPASTSCLDVKFSLDFAHGRRQRWCYDDVEAMLASRVCNARGLYRPSGIHALVLYAAHIALRERGVVEQRHIDAMQHYIDSYQGELATSEQRDLAREMSEALRVERESVSAELKARIAPFFTRTRASMTRSRGLRLGMGFRVLFLGTDGVGKTTLIAETKRVLGVKVRTLYLGVGREGWRFALVRRFSKFKPNSRIGSLFKSVLYTYGLLPVELLARRISALRGGKYQVFLIDRFPGWPFIRGGLGRVIYSLVLPRPDLIVFLTGDSEVLARRKPDEVQVAQSVKDDKKFRFVAQAIGAEQMIEIDTTRQDVDTCVRLIVDAIGRHPAYRKALFKEIKIS